MLTPSTAPMQAKYHPDKNDDPKAEDKYIEVAEALETLGDEDKRRIYDQFGEQKNDARSVAGPTRSFRALSHSYARNTVVGIMASKADLAASSSKAAGDRVSMHTTSSSSSLAAVAAVVDFNFRLVICVC
jgi:DnaJ-class molecular chaperone